VGIGGVSKTGAVKGKNTFLRNARVVGGKSPAVEGSQEKRESSDWGDGFDLGGITTHVAETTVGRGDRASWDTG